MGLRKKFGSIGSVEIERKGIWEECQDSNQHLVSKPGLEINRNELCRGVLAHSHLCLTDADVWLKEKCGSVGRGCNKTCLRNGGFTSASGAIFGPQTRLSSGDKCVFKGSPCALRCLSD